MTRLSRAGRISRQFSMRAVMESVLQGGPISRASIAKQTGLSKQTVSEIVRQLELERWVAETGRTNGHVGRTAVTYEIIPSAALIAAVDLGGTTVRLAISDLTGKVLHETAEATDRRGGRAVVDQIAALCTRAAATTDAGRDRLRLLVAGVPGAPQAASGRVLLAPNIRGFDAMDVASALEAALGLDVVLENDVNLAVLGETWQGSGVGIDNLAFISLGTGVGSGLMLAGQLIRGADGAAGELGFLPFGADPFAAESLRVGAFERAVASVGIRRRYSAIAGASADVPEIFARAGAGDPPAVQVLDETARYLARGVAAICAVANPQKVILGGSIGARPEIIERVRAALPLCFPSPVEVAPSLLGSQAALIGGVAVGLSRLHNTLFATDAPDTRISLPPTRMPPLQAVLP